MDRYRENSSKVIQLLQEYGYHRASVDQARYCYRDLEKELISQGRHYSPPFAEEWCRNLEQKHSNYRVRSYRNALRFLAEMYETGVVRNRKPGTACHRLAEPFQKHLIAFLKESEETYSSDSLRRFRNDCSCFLLYAQNHGAASVSEISYNLMHGFYIDLEYDSGRTVNLISSIVSFLSYLYKTGCIRYGPSIYYHYLAFGAEPVWQAVANEDTARIKEIMASEDTEDPERLVDCRAYLDFLYQQNDYAKGPRREILRHTDLLYLFLDNNHYRYHPEIARIWQQSKHSYLHCPHRKSHRSVCLIEQYMKNGCANVDSSFRSDTRTFDQIPEWCWNEAHEYESMKLKEGWEKSTMDMIRSSISRFCISMDLQGLRSFSDLTANHIKTFSLNDKHKTAAGKNAYNLRIRRFLIFLGEKGYLSNRMLFTALPRENAPKETVVVVLTEDEMKQLNNCIQNENSEVSLRKKAMLLLGLKMGLRESDIVNLKFDDIDWDTQTIRFIQKKTLVEVNLPMPTSVGNALFRYITQERHSKNTPYIFLSESAPYTRVSRSACNRALDSVLPDRNVHGSGFHVTRKTFATQNLRSGVGAEVVGEALGQRGTASVHRYLSLDDERMKLCALTFEQNRIGGW